jgi:hypothetical protein
LSGTTAVQRLTIYDNLLLMALRMTFGGSPCPSLWGFISDTIADLSNTLIQNTHWNHWTLFDQLSNTLDKPLALPESIPFHQTKHLSVNIPINDIGKVNIYIDDSIGIAPDLDDNVNRVSSAIPLVNHSMARPTNPSDKIPRKDIISLKKFLAEGRM